MGRQDGFPLALLPRRPLPWRRPLSDAAPSFLIGCRDSLVELGEIEDRSPDGTVVVGGVLDILPEA